MVSALPSDPPPHPYSRDPPLSRELRRPVHTCCTTCTHLCWLQQSVIKSMALQWEKKGGGGNGTNKLWAPTGHFFLWPGLKEWLSGVTAWAPLMSLFSSTSHAVKYVLVRVFNPTYVYETTSPKRLFILLVLLSYAPLSMEPQDNPGKCLACELWKSCWETVGLNHRRK